jgi:hypothetical protein
MVRWKIYVDFAVEISFSSDLQTDPLGKEPTGLSEMDNVLVQYQS